MSLLNHRLNLRSNASATSLITETRKQVARLERAQAKLREAHNGHIKMFSPEESQLHGLMNHAHDLRLLAEHLERLNTKA
jgi:hypothetical protein